MIFSVILGESTISLFFEAVLGLLVVRLLDTLLGLLGFLGVLLDLLGFLLLDSLLDLLLTRFFEILLGLLVFRFLDTLLDCFFSGTVVSLETVVDFGVSSSLVGFGLLFLVVLLDFLGFICLVVPDLSSVSSLETFFFSSLLDFFFEQQSTQDIVIIMGITAKQRIKVELTKNVQFSSVE